MQGDADMYCPTSRDVVGRDSLRLASGDSADEVGPWLKSPTGRFGMCASRHSHSWAAKSRCGKSCSHDEDAPRK